MKKLIIIAIPVTLLIVYFSNTESGSDVKNTIPPSIINTSPDKLPVAETIRPAKEESVVVDAAATDSSSDLDFELATAAVTQQTVNPKYVKKRFEEDWCFATHQLNQKDQLVAQTQVRDWELYRGNSEVNHRFEEMPGYHDHHNNEFVAAYEEMTPEQIEEHAIKGDKWAMIAYMQVIGSKRNTEIQIAKQLLAMGATYHSLPFMVEQHLVDARILASRPNADPSHSIASALALVHWGLEQYESMGLLSFLAAMAGDSNPITEDMLRDAYTLVDNKYEELTHWIEHERQKQGWKKLAPEKAAIIEFEANMAYIEHDSDFDRWNPVLRELRITDVPGVRNATCIAQIARSYDQDELELQKLAENKTEY